MRRIEKELLQALQEIVAACSDETIKPLHKEQPDLSVYAFTVGKVSEIAERAIRAAKAKTFDAKLSI